MDPIDAPPAVATVVLTVTDVNDNAPQFYSQTYTGYVPEDASLGHIVLASIEAFDIDEVYAMRASMWWEPLA